jgi:all-trans-8'-apo-beta-carotenal 15,15'-oxygenase
VVSETSRRQDKTQSRLSNSGHDHEAWKNGYTTCSEEIGPVWIDCPDLPSDFPEGTYYRNGHGRFESDDGVRVFHMFDGDGMVCAATFENEGQCPRILFRNRFVRTAGYRKDKQEGIMSKPGTFGTKASGGLLKNLFRTDFKNVANTHVFYGRGNHKLYALWEGGYVLTTSHVLSWSNFDTLYLTIALSFRSLVGHIF